MRSIEARFKKEIKKSPALGLYMALKEAIRGQLFSDRSIALAFNKLIPKDDYDPGCKKDLALGLREASRPPRRAKNRHISSLGGA